MLPIHRRIGSGERYVGLYRPENAPGVDPFVEIGADKGFVFIILSGEYILEMFVMLENAWHKARDDDRIAVQRNRISELKMLFVIHEQFFSFL